MNVTALANETEREGQGVLAFFAFGGPAPNTDLIHAVVIPFHGAPWVARDLDTSDEDIRAVQRLEQLYKHLARDRFLVLLSFQILHKTLHQYTTLQRSRIVGQRIMVLHF